MLNLLLIAAVALTTGFTGSTRAAVVDNIALNFTYWQNDLDSSQCSCPNTRSVLDIIWSCLATIFLCTWVSIHPNLPPAGEHSIRTFFSRLKLMFTALIGPEVVLLFSMRQWLAARELSNKYKDRGWTVTHGFFLIMGGFVLMKGDEDMGTLSFDTLEGLTASGEIDFPTLTKEDIEDKSKSDALAKGLVILQTLWFIIQMHCSRLNGSMYFFWWHKPFDVQRRMSVFLKPESDYVHKYELKRAEVIEDPGVAARDIMEVLHEIELPLVENEGQTDASRKNSGPTTSWLQRIRRSIKSMKDLIPIAFARQARIDWNNHVKSYPIVLVVLYWAFAFLVLLPIVALIALPLFALPLLIFYLFNLNVSGTHPLPPGQNRVGTFYSPELKGGHKFLMFTIFFVTTTVFEGLHCIAWRFEFPTRAEFYMWQALSMCIAFVPSALLVLSIPMGLGGSAQESLASSRSIGGIFLWVISTIILSSSIVLLLFFSCSLDPFNRVLRIITRFISKGIVRSRLA